MPILILFLLPNYNNASLLLILEKRNAALYLPACYWGSGRPRYIYWYRKLKSGTPQFICFTLLICLLKKRNAALHLLRLLLEKRKAALHTGP